MNPYPFVGLNHFTVPIGINLLQVSHALGIITPLSLKIRIETTMHSYSGFEGSVGGLRYANQFTGFRISGRSRGPHFDSERPEAP
jgi:hypothetical protein